MPLTEGHAAPFSADTRGSATQAALLDAHGRGTLLVVGSEPPDGRDLDLLIPDAGLGETERRLAGAGFERHGHEWARFEGPRVELVELTPASSWGLPGAVLEALLTDAEPIEPYARLRRPAPADGLLVLARRRLGVHGPLADKHRRRIAALEAADPAAWETAAARSADWNVSRALAVLRAASRSGTAPAALRARAAAEAARAQRRGLTGALAGAARAVAPSPPRGAVIAVSGIDGAGKSTQAAGLVLTLSDLGQEAAVEWSRITYDPVLRRIGAAPKRLLGWLARRAGDAHEDGADEDPGTAVAGALRERVAAADHAWALTVAVVHALGQRRALKPHLRAGRVVVRDRYVLDATVQLVESYGVRRDVRLQAAVLRRACPVPVAAFWLDVDPGEAYRRKPEEYTAAELAGHRRRYQAAYAALGVERVDASRDPEVVAADLARRVWRRLA